MRASALILFFAIFFFALSQIRAKKKCTFGTNIFTFYNLYAILYTIYLLWRYFNMKISDNKPHSIHLRLTDAQYSFCKNNAEVVDVSISDFIRMVVNGVMVSAKKCENISLGDLEDADNQSN